MIKFANSVRCPKSAIIVAAAANARETLSFGDTYVSSMNDRSHMPTSKHYTDEAADFRTRDLEPVQVAAWAAMCRVRLGAGYQVIVEKDHLHIEWQSS